MVHRRKSQGFDIFFIAIGFTSCSPQICEVSTVSSAIKLLQEVQVFLWIHLISLLFVFYLVDVFSPFFFVRRFLLGDFMTIICPHLLRGMHIFNASIQCMPSWLLALTLLPSDADVATCNAFLSKSAGAWEVALAVMKMMQAESLADLISYSTVISNLDFEAVFFSECCARKSLKKKNQIAWQKECESQLTFGRLPSHTMNCKYLTSAMLPLRCVGRAVAGGVTAHEGIALCIVAPWSIGSGRVELSLELAHSGHSYPVILDSPSGGHFVADQFSILDDSKPKEYSRCTQYILDLLEGSANSTKIEIEQTNTDLYWYPSGLMISDSDIMNMLGRQCSDERWNFSQSLVPWDTSSMTCGQWLQGVM